MAKKEHICTNCGQLITGEIIKKGRKEYCEDCMFEIDPEWADWCKLFEYVKRLYNIKTLTPQMITQLHKYKDEKMTYYGMLMTLKYVYEILEMQLDTDKGVGIIPYFYDKASKFNNRKMDIEDLIEDFELKDNKKTITTKRNDTYKKEIKTISLDRWKEQE